jgi:predicted O-methyltransferase YrrM
MYEASESWRAVDAYFTAMLVDEDEALRSARLGGPRAGLPAHEVTPNQGALLAILTRLAGARRVLEIGTLVGYSTIWFARAVGVDGHVTTLEVDAVAASLALKNLEHAGVADRVDIHVGPARESLDELIATAPAPYDLVFIDADKPNNPAYLEAALQLTRSGSVIIADNVVRNGAVTDPLDEDPRVQGVRAFLDLLRENPQVEATAIQTVGSKGWDGFAIARIT